RERQAPASDPLVPAPDNGPSDTAGADDDDAAVLPTMCSDTGRMCIAGDHGAAERQVSGLCGVALARLTGAGEGQTGKNPRDRLKAESGFAKTLPSGPQHLGEAVVESEADIRRAGGPLAEDMSGAVGKPCAAPGAAAIDAEKQIGTPICPLHALLLPESSPNWLNAREQECAARVYQRARVLETAAGNRTTEPPLYRDRPVEPGGDPRRDGRGAIRCGGRRACRASGVGASGARDRGTAARGRTAGLRGRRHVGAARGAGRRRADADLQLAGGAPADADGG